MLADFWIDDLAAVGFEALVGPFFVSPHQSRIAHHIGRQYRGEAACGTGLREVARRATAVGKPRSNKRAWDISPPVYPVFQGNPDMRIANIH